MSFELRERISRMYEKYDMQADELGDLLIDLARALPHKSPEREGMFWVRVEGPNGRPYDTIAKLSFHWVNESKRNKTAVTIEGNAIDPYSEDVIWLKEAT